MRLPGRVSLVAISLFLLAGFAVARSVEPDSRGFGTHQRLGLPPCTFQVLFQRPCPACGMTTSFSHFVRGNLAGSAQANIGGLILALMSLATIPWCWVSACRGRYWGMQSPWLTALIMSGTVLAVTGIDWFCKVWWR